MKNFDIRIGSLNLKGTDILKLVGSSILLGSGLALITDFSDKFAYMRGMNDTLAYLNRTQQYDVVDTNEIIRRGKVYDAKKFLESQGDID